MIPANQCVSFDTRAANTPTYTVDRLSTDDFAGTLVNQTNLAIKGTIGKCFVYLENVVKRLLGIKAMSVVAGLLGKSDVAANYSVCFSLHHTH